MTVPTFTSRSRFIVMSRGRDGSSFYLPYRDMQGEFLANSGGEQMRLTVPVRGLGLGYTQLFPGKHELWIYDQEYSKSDPIFYGPIWDATMSSGDGTLSVSATGQLHYLKKRLLKISRSFKAQQPADIMASLHAIANVDYTLPFAFLKVTSNTSTVDVKYDRAELRIMADLFEELSDMADSTDYLIRSVGGVNRLRAYGGGRVPAAQTFNLAYGGQISSYALTQQAQGIANYVVVASQTGYVGTYSEAIAAETEYGMRFERGITGARAKTGPPLHDHAVNIVRATQRTTPIPQITLRQRPEPFRDFDVFDIFNIAIDDEWSQYEGTIRVAGFQMTVGRHDQITTVIYGNNTSAVS